jgi:cytochrome P450
MSYPVGATATLAELEGDPHPLLARLRASEPVSWVPVLGGWLVTRHDLALRVMRDAAAFTVDDPRFSTAQVIGPSMLSLDGAAHTRHRDPFARSFRPADVRDRFAGFVTAEVDRLIGLLTPARPGGAAELRRAIAGPLAVAVVAEALGLRGADATTIRSWYRAFVEAISDITAGRQAGPAGPEAFSKLRSSVDASLNGGSGPSLLATAAGTGGLSTAEVVSNAAVLMFGGIDTAEGMIANAALYLLADPGRLDLVRRDPSRLPAAIEESARLEPSAAVVDRYATRPVTLAGAAIERGDLVRVSLAGANRDPAVFSDPDLFDIRRPNRGPSAHPAPLTTAVGHRCCLRNSGGTSLWYLRLRRCWSRPDRASRARRCGARRPSRGRRCPSRRGCRPRP